MAALVGGGAAARGLTPPGESRSAAADVPRVEQTTVPSRSRPPALAALAGVLGLLGAAGSGLLCLIVLGLGRMDDGRWELGGWAVVLLVAAMAQAWGAVRLLRHRGWALLALGSIPALLPLLLSMWCGRSTGSRRASWTSSQPCPC